MRRMHERQNIGKVILLPEPKKKEEKSEVDAAENVEKNEAAVSEKKEEEEEEEVKAENWARGSLHTWFTGLLTLSKMGEKTHEMSWILRFVSIF